MKARIMLPYLLLTVLLGIGLFLAGIKHGRKVERTNKVIDVLLSISPSQPPPTPVIVEKEKPLEFKTISNKYCGITFIYPATITLTSGEESNAGTLRFTDKDKKNPLTVQCFGPRITGVLDREENVATATVTFKNKKVIAESPQGSGMYKLRVTHPQTGYILIISIDKKLFPLFERTLEFTT